MGAAKCMTSVPYCPAKPVHHRRVWLSTMARQVLRHQISIGDQRGFGAQLVPKRVEQHIGFVETEGRCSPTGMNGSRNRYRPAHAMRREHDARLFAEGTN